MARALMAVFGEVVDVVVTNAAGCGSALKEYGHWLPGRGRRRLSRRRCATSARCSSTSDLPLGELKETVAYHDACHLAHGQKVRAQPRELLRRIPGLTVVDIKDSRAVLRQRGDLQSHRARHGRGARQDEGRAHTRDRRARRGGRQSRAVSCRSPRQARELGVELEVVHPVDLLARALRET